MKTKAIALLALLALASPGPARAEGWTDPHAGTARREIAFVTSTGRHPVAVEVASDEESRDAGLSGRDTVPAGTGMLYDFGEDRDVGMWMKDNRIALDMVFVRADGQVADVRPDNTPGDLAPVKAALPVRYVVEMPAGAAAAMGLARLDTLDLAGQPPSAAAAAAPAPGAGEDGRGDE